MNNKINNLQLNIFKYIIFSYLDYGVNVDVLIKVHCLYQFMRKLVTLRIILLAVQIYYLFHLKVVIRIWVYNMIIIVLLHQSLPIIINIKIINFIFLLFRVFSV